MATLSAGDAERLLRFVAEAGSVDGDQPFTPELLVELGRLIEADFVTYTENDHVRRRSLVYLPRPGDEDEVDGEIPDDEWDHMHEHPICVRWRKDGRFTALRLSDATTRRQLHDSRFYALFCKPWGVEHELKYRLPSPPWHVKTLMFNRRAGRDFTKRDRLVLELLAPHLVRLWNAARTRRLLNSALAELERGSEKAQRGLVLLSTAGEVEFASPEARRLVSAFFAPTKPGRLPADIVAWLDAGALEPLRRRNGGSALTVERSGDTLLLSERNGDVALTRREIEVMGWVARGKMNAQIAELLWVAPSTVRKHLENVYAKLGVSTRTAAAARFLGAIDADSS